MRIGLLSILPLVVAIVIGTRILHRLPRERLRMIVFVFLFVTGVKYGLTQPPAAQAQPTASAPATQVSAPIRSRRTSNGPVGPPALAAGSEFGAGEWESREGRERRRDRATERSPGGAIQNVAHGVSRGFKLR